MVAKPTSGSRRLGLRHLLLAVALAAAACDRQGDTGTVVDDRPMAEAVFVGGEVCSGCHPVEAARWQGSHHDLAMQDAEVATVLGDFDNAEFRYGDIMTRFYRRDGEFRVSTDGPDGVQGEFVVTQTFGADPLQQYLIEFDDGRVQVLSVAWDSRPADQGGQRWFHLYPDESIDYRNPLHWTGVYQRWNSMCADCHSTNLIKGYDPETDRFDTRYASIDVGCEACHGPGSVHAADPAIPPPALPGGTHSWVFNEGESIASRLPAEAPQAEIAVCAQCHSLRAQLTDAHLPGEPLLNGYRPALLSEGLYHADGQILGEVYVYGSFLQSAMAAAGVVCSDCHEPHSGALRSEGNGVCAQCHLASTYDRVEHHRHAAGSDGAACAACHMRAETYMVVDPRRDHSFRVPRPDLTDSLGSPNACNDCHDDQTSEWAAARVGEWYPDGRQNEAHFGQALQAGRAWSADARTQLIALIGDPDAPAIVRATALSLLAERMVQADSAVLEQSLNDDDPIVRLGAVEAAAALPLESRASLVQRLLTDDLLALRVAAGRVLLNARNLLSARRQSDLDAAMAEYLVVQRFNSDRSEGRLNAAIVAIDEGRLADAERLLIDAISRQPADTALHVSLAELYRSMGRTAESEQILRDGLDANPDDAAVPLSLGFALVRGDRASEALPYFEQAAAIATGEPYYQYVLAIANNDAGNADRALEQLRAVNARFPGHAESLFALITVLRDTGAIEEAYQHAERLNAMSPGDPDVRALLRELEQRL